MELLIGNLLKREECQTITFNQEDLVLNHLKRVGGISQRTAVVKYGIYRLSAIIFKLRKKGLNISSSYKTGRNRYGNISNWVVYHLDEKIKDNLAL